MGLLYLSGPQCTNDYPGINVMGPQGCVQDPSLHTRGAGASVVSRDYFLEHLARAGLEPVWVLAGEKNVYAARTLLAAMDSAAVSITQLCSQLMAET